MEPKRIHRLRRYLTQRYAIIAFLTSLLVANSDTGNFFLPALVLLVVIASYVLVDWLEVFHIERLGSYFGMGIASVIALVTLIISVFRSSESGQLMAVAGLLIYPQCVLFFQKKSIRVFEQLAIFFLLQMIVAALINDNYMYGLLLAPILLLWVSSLILFARYATLVDVMPDVDRPVPLLYELVYQRFIKSIRKTSLPLHSVTSLPQVDVSLSTVHRKHRFLLTVPLSLGALVFAALLFVLLPRTNNDAHLGQKQKEVGLSDRVSVGMFGRVLSNPEQMMRLKLLDSQGQVYPVHQPPYLRVGVVDTYLPPVGSYEPGYWTAQHPVDPTTGDSGQPLCEQGDLVTVEVTFRKRIRQELVCIPPLVASHRNLPYRASEMVFDNRPNYDPGARRTQVYRFESLGFSGGSPITVIPDFHQEVAASVTARLPRELPRGNKKRLEILRQAGVIQDNRSVSISTAARFAAAKALESHLKYSGEYTYTLDLPPPVDADIDPIEDFVVHLKTGLCQSYAAALVAMLRQSGIPSRIVIGYLAADRNKLGQHFIVRQSDAHAWVEARFSRAELLGTEVESSLCDAPYYWVQLDASPGIEQADRAIVETAQSLDYADKLWEDYVSASDKLHEMDLYGNMAQDGKVLMGNLASDWSQVLGGVGGNLFQQRSMRQVFRVVVGAFFVLVACILVWQIMVWMPYLAPNLSRRLGILRHRSQLVHQVFYARMLNSLESLPMVRADSETLHEFSRRALAQIHNTGGTPTNDLAASVEFLNYWYHQSRFGPELTIGSELRRELEEHVQNVEKTVRACRKV